MDTIHALRMRTFALGIGLCSILLSGCAGFGPAPTLMADLPTTNWQIFQNRGGSKRAVPPGESLERYTELVQMDRIYRPFFGASSPTEWLAEYQARLDETHTQES